jgi:5'-nucleotidase
MSHALTLSKPLRVECIRRTGGFEGWGVSGTPTDCVKIGLKKILGVVPDLLVSGINEGSNLGKNIFYSGTVSAAHEGALNNIPSIAISLNSFQSKDWGCSKAIALKVIDYVLGNKLPKGTFLNVNIPNCHLKEVRGIKVTEQGNQYFNDTFKKRIDPRKSDYYWIDGKIIDMDKNLKSDGYAVANNYVSITPLKYDITSHFYIKKLKKDF